MNALQSYSSDNESDEEPVIKKMNKIADSGTNYDDVGMDISEDSGDDAAADAAPRNERSANSTSNNDRSNSYSKSDAAPSSTESGNGKMSQISESVKAVDKKSSDLECSSGRTKLSEENHKNDRHTTTRYKRSRSRDRNNRSRSRERNNRSRSKERTNRSGSKEKNNRSRSKERNNRSKSQERTVRDPERITRDRKDSRDHKDSRRSTDNRDGRDYRRRVGRRSRSRSRDRRRSRSRSRSRDRDRRKRRTRSRSRSRSRSRDRKRPHEIRREAQQKLAAFKASNPNFDHNEMLKRGMEAQFAEVQKNTGVTLPTYYNPAIMNPLKIAEQERKKKLLWGNKAKADATVAAEPVGGSETLWVNTKFSNDSDGKMAEKFKRLMGVRAGGASSSHVPSEVCFHDSNKDSSEILEKQETLFNSMEKQYEVARLATHTQRGFGLGFSSQSYLPK